MYADVPSINYVQVHARAKVLKIENSFARTKHIHIHTILNIESETYYYFTGALFRHKTLVLNFACSSQGCMCVRLNVRSTNTTVQHKRNTHSVFYEFLNPHARKYARIFGRTDNSGRRPKRKDTTTSLEDPSGTHTQQISS